MPEYYNLPVLFTEEERCQYAQWGMKKEKVEGPTILIAGISFLVISVFAVQYIVKIFELQPGILGYILIFLCLLTVASPVIAFLVGVLVMIPMDKILDKMFGKPKDPRMLRLEPTPEGVQYHLFQGKRTLGKGVLSWQAWQSAVLPETNEIWIEGQCLNIGANTIENIYPEGHRHSYMEHPAEKIVGTLDLGKIRKNLEGYLASLEERKRELEWLARNPTAK